jgi:hypothetical protein
MSEFKRIVPRDEISREDESWKNSVNRSVNRITNLQAYADNAQAVGGGLKVGDFYRTGGNPDLVCVVH